MMADKVNVEVDLEERLGWWSRAGLITEDQARRILDQEREWEHAVAPSDGMHPGIRPGVGSGAPASVGPEMQTRRLSAIVEGLGYIGGILTLVGAVLLVARYWDDMSTVARLALGVGASALLLIGGLLVRETDSPLVRLRWALWTLSTATAAVTVGVALADGVDDIEPAAVMLSVAGVVALENGLLWGGRRRPVQQALFLGALPFITGSITALIGDRDMEFTIIGVVIALTGALILTAGVTGRTTYAALTDGIGAIALVIGSASTIDGWHGGGHVLALAVVTFVLALAFAPTPVAHSDERLVLGVVAGVTMWQLVPASIVYFARDAGMLTGLVVAVIGVGLLELGRRRAVELPLLVTIVGGAALVGGLAVTGAQSVAFATIAGLVMALALIALGTRPGWAIMSVFGCVGLLVNVPWAIYWFFPGEGQAPLLIVVAGVLIIGAAVLLARMRGRIRSELDQDAPMSRGGARPSMLPR